MTTAVAYASAYGRLSARSIIVLIALESIAESCNDAAAKERLLEAINEFSDSVGLIDDKLALDNSATKELRDEASGT